MLQRMTPALEVDIGQARAYLDVQVRTGNSLAFFSRVKARLPVAAGPTMSIRREGFVASIGKALGGQDIVLGGNEEFDKAYVVRTNDEERTRTMWTERAKTLMLHELPRPKVTCDGSLITLVVGDVLADEAAISAGLDLIGELANADLFGLEALSELKDAEYHQPTGPWDDRTAPFARVEALIPVTLSLFVNRGVATTKASGKGVVEERGGQLRISSDGSYEGDDEILSERSRSAIRRVGAATLTVSDGSAELLWEGIENEVDHLEAGVELIASMADVDRDAYR